MISRVAFSFLGLLFSVSETFVSGWVFALLSAELFSAGTSGALPAVLVSDLAFSISASAFLVEISYSFFALAYLKEYSLSLISSLALAIFSRFLVLSNFSLALAFSLLAFSTARFSISEVFPAGLSTSPFRHELCSDLTLGAFSIALALPVVLISIPLVILVSRSTFFCAFFALASAALFSLRSIILSTASFAFFSFSVTSAASFLAIFALALAFFNAELARFDDLTDFTAAFVAFPTPSMPAPNATSIAVFSAKFFANAFLLILPFSFTACDADIERFMPEPAIASAALLAAKSPTFFLVSFFVASFAAFLAASVTPFFAAACAAFFVATLLIDFAIAPSNGAPVTAYCAAEPTSEPTLPGMLLSTLVVLICFPSLIWFIIFVSTGADVRNALYKSGFSFAAFSSAFAVLVANPFSIPAFLLPCLSSEA